MELEKKNAKYSKELPAWHPYFTGKETGSHRDQVTCSGQRGYLGIDTHFHKRCEDAIQSCSEYWGTHYPSWQLRAESLSRNALSAREPSITRSQPSWGPGLLPWRWSIPEGPSQLQSTPQGTDWLRSLLQLHHSWTSSSTLPSYFYHPSLPSSVVPEKLPE